MTQRLVNDPRCGEVLEWSCALNRGSTQPPAAELGLRFVGDALKVLSERRIRWCSATKGAVLTHSTCEISDDDLAAIFGSTINGPRAVLQALQLSPERAVRVDELVASTGLRMIDVVVAVARLTHAGFIEHPAAGIYQAKPPTEVRRAG